MALLIDYELDGETFITDTCMDCPLSYVDDLDCDWHCMAKKCSYSDKEREEIAKKELEELMREEVGNEDRKSL